MLWPRWAGTVFLNGNHSQPYATGNVCSSAPPQDRIHLRPELTRILITGTEAFTRDINSLRCTSTGSKLWNEWLARCWWNEVVHLRNLTWVDGTGRGTMESTWYRIQKRMSWTQTRIRLVIGYSVSDYKIGDGLDRGWMGGERGRGINTRLRELYESTNECSDHYLGDFLLNEKGRSVFVIWELLLWFLSLLSVRL